MNILVTGGAGYVGSHAARWLQEAGHDVWVYDNLSTGHHQAVLPDQMIEGELCDQPLLERLFSEKAIDVVMHFAASSLVGESVTDPGKYYRNNVLGSFRLLEAMRSANVQKLVFSSTTAVYGNPQEVPIHEGLPRCPINPYGWTKYIVEEMLAHYCHAYGLGYAALRYFNAAGAAADGSIGEDHDPESHLIPLVLQVALGQRESITLFGEDYPTPDGTCIRDYVHVDDLARAHQQALDQLQPGRGWHLNLGSGSGASVLEVIEACRRVTGHPIPVIHGERRPGDAPILVADSRQAKEVLQWEPKFVEIDEIVRSAWRWHQTHPAGYSD
ncbi:MAG TPA: UDP-glucose 4-epimerase GalE [Planctomycetaceae bacterium]|nr:UDP-glucose 4-epimerase GalE [Planctomycetaceae bacterium]